VAPRMSTYVMVLDILIFLPLSPEARRIR